MSSSHCLRMLQKDKHAQYEEPARSVTLQQKPPLTKGTRTSCSYPSPIPHSGLEGMLQESAIPEDGEVKQSGFAKEWEIKAGSSDNRAKPWTGGCPGEQHQDTAGVFPFSISARWVSMLGDLTCSFCINLDMLVNLGKPGKCLALIPMNMMETFLYSHRQSTSTAQNKIWLVSPFIFLQKSVAVSRVPQIMTNTQIKNYYLQVIWNIGNIFYSFYSWQNASNTGC